VKPLKKLGRKHKLFINEYVQSVNATQSAIKAGFTPKNAASTACNLLKDKLIKDELSKKFQEVLLTPAEIKRLYKKFVDNNNVSDKDQLHALDSLAKIEGLVSQVNNTTVNVKYDDKEKQLLESYKDTKVTKIA